MSISTAALTLVTTTLNNERSYIVPQTAQTKPTTRRRSYRKEAPNAKALTQATAWLKAAGIAVTPSEVDGCHLSVKARDGKTVEVAVLISHEEPTPIGSNLVVLACELTSRHSATALRAFQTITCAAGYGARKPIDRGPEPEKKLQYEQNFELVAMRHKEFRKVPNPTAEELKAFDRVINKAVARAMFINRKIFARHTLQDSDLKTYAQIWTCNYLGLYKVANPTDNDNERKLYAHLCQRFGNFIEVLLKKERNCIPDGHAVSIALTGKPYESIRSSLHSVRSEAEDNFEATFEEALEAEIDADVVEPDADEFLAPEMGMIMVPLAQATAEDEENERNISDAKRRKQAQKALKTALSTFDHDTLIRVLEETHANTNFCYDARAEAQKQLRLHREDCASCAQAKE